MWYLILVLVIILFVIILFVKSTNEDFIPLDELKTYSDLYKKDKLKYIPKEIPYSNFLIDLNNNFKSELNKVQPKSPVVVGAFKQKVLCDDKLNIQVQKNALNKAFDKVSSSYPTLLVFEGSKDNQRNHIDPQAYIKPKTNQISISDEMKYSNHRYTSKIDPSLKNQNNKKIIQDIKFQDDPDFNYFTEKDDNMDSCVYKANQLSQYTNPNLYLSSDNIRFPPRWIFSPYKNIPLPKTTNLKLWTDMYNCCSNNF